MRCDEIQERFIELLYDEKGTPSAGEDLQAHVRSCLTCRAELEGLKGVQGALKLWKDEPPLQSAAIPANEPFVPAWRRFDWRYLRYAGIAATVVIIFLALGNTQITWNKGEFSFRTHLFSQPVFQQDYYTKAEVRQLMKRALDDTESRMTETNYLMVQRMLDIIEQDRWMDLRFVRDQATQGRNKN